ncbi:MAG: (2Fe-2S)-binding protein [Lachnospirales bacterium]
MEKIEIKFNLNNSEQTVYVKPNMRLLDVLRDELHLTGTKEGCAVGECGACTVILDGQAVTACLVLAGQIHGRNVVTIEGVGTDGKLDPIQEAILKHHALQCGFCTPGFVMSAKALLDQNPKATRDEIRQAISGNLCRCTGYEQLIEAIHDAASELEAQGKALL